MKRAKTIIWIIIAVIFVLLAVNSFTLHFMPFKIALRFTMAGVSITAVCCIFWAFLGVQGKPR